MTARILSIGFALLAAACASQAAPAPARSTPSSDTLGERPPSDAGTKLEILVWPAGEGRGDRITHTLTCHPAGGTHPDPAQACAALEKLGRRAFAPVPADAVCTQQYGGPMEARVRGVVQGQPVDARLAYTDGCQIARWDRLDPVVPRPRGERKPTIIR